MGPCQHCCAGRARFERTRSLRPRSTPPMSLLCHPALSAVGMVQSAFGEHYGCTSCPYLELPLHERALAHAR
jgi:hypothetical protein